MTSGGTSVGSMMQRKLGAVAVLSLLLLEGLSIVSALPAAPASGESSLFRVYVFTDRYVYSPDDNVKVTVQLTNLQPDPVGGLTINSSILGSGDSEVMSLPPMSGESIGALQTAYFNESTPISLPDANYQIVSDVYANGTRQALATVPLVVLNTTGRAPLTLALVFHMHQPIYLNLQGQFEQPWVQLHSGSDFELNGTWYGSYYWHVYMLETHPSIKVTFNLQPSLLYQWNVTMNDFAYNGTYPGGTAELDRDLAAVNATVAGYRALAADGQAEILTSPFYHPLSAILVQLGFSSDLLAQIELGKNYTDQFMGVSAHAMWTPEMGFTMGMVPIMQEAGIEYTVLDGQDHFAGAEGPSASASMYQPFELDGPNGSRVAVFFRDTGISDNLTSVWNYVPVPQVAASDFIAAVAGVYRSSPGGVLTIASDGENPIAQADGLISALDFDAIYGAIASQGWIQTSTLGGILATRPVNATLTSLPNASWSGGFGLWIGAPQKNAIWTSIIAARRTLVNITSVYGASNPEIEKLWNYLYIAEGSDWEWNTPGPSWFAMQGYRYADAAMTFEVPRTTTSQGGGPPPWSGTYAAPLALGGFAAVAVASFAVLWLRRKRR